MKRLQKYLHLKLNKIQQFVWSYDHFKLALQKIQCLLSPIKFQTCKIIITSEHFYSCIVIIFLQQSTVMNITVISILERFFFNFQGSNSLFFVGIFRLPDDEKFQCCIYINCHYASHFDGSFFGLKELVFCVPRVTFDMMLARDIHSKFKCCIRSWTYKKVSVWYRRAVLIDGFRTLIYFYKYPAVLLLTWRY